MEFHHLPINVLKYPNPPKKNITTMAPKAMHSLTTEQESEVQHICSTLVTFDLLPAHLSTHPHLSPLLKFYMHAHPGTVD